MLRRINLLYLAIPLLIWYLWYLFGHLNRSTAIFYGFAENKETSINLDHDLVVKRLWVKPGQFVKKGAILLEVSRIALDFKMNELASGIAELQSKDRWRTADLSGRIAQLRAEKNEKIAAYQSEIQVIRSEQALNRRLLQGLKSVSVSPDSIREQESPFTAQINALQAEMRTAIEPYDKEIERMENEIQLAGLPEKEQIGRLQKDLDLYRKEADRLSIYAPADGLIGTIFCKEGENIPAFTTLIAFYEQNPNLVVGYVHESLSLQMQVGDSLRVTSSLHPTEHCMGAVSGLGHRIVEIPQRLRKIPELPTYGREILIDIPSSNQFLQKEKVILQRPH